MKLFLKGAALAVATYVVVGYCAIAYIAYALGTFVGEDDL